MKNASYSLSMSKNVLLETENGIATVTVNRPEKRNAMNIPTREELRKTFEQLEDDDSVAVVVLRGAGEDSYLAGGDIEMFQTFELVDALEFTNKYSQGLYNYIAEFPKPTIAAIDGYALGGGTEISLACDIRLASEKAKFGFPEVDLGLFPAAGGSQRVIDVIGPGKAKELIFTGNIIDAKEAKELGLVNHVYDTESFDEEVEEMAGEIAGKAPLALRLAKESVNRGLDQEGGLDFERVAGALLFGTEDYEEGVAAFLEDREADFVGK